MPLEYVSIASAKDTSLHTVFESIRAFIFEGVAFSMAEMHHYGGEMTFKSPKTVVY